MSIKLFEEDVFFLQRFLKGSGFYTWELDGIWGGKTDAASRAFEEETMKIADIFGKFDPRSEKAICSLHPLAQRAARVFLGKIFNSNIDGRIISGTRTYAERNALYRKGRFGNPGPIVTKAKGGQSNHNFGIAWDLAIFNGRGVPRGFDVV